MASLLEYYRTDFADCLGYGSSFTTRDPEKITIFVNTLTNNHSNAKFVAYYAEPFSNFLELCITLVVRASELVGYSACILTAGGYPGEIDLGVLGSANSVFAKRIYIYSENALNTHEQVRLDEFAKYHNLNVTLRGAPYMANRMANERPKAFISHDSRDKETVAYPIAIGLMKLLCPVWYDEFSLKVGNPLRESIEKGMKDSHKCILILSYNFFSNNGWTKTEFDAIFTREVINNKLVILPVWYDVSASDVYQYSPSLANRLGLNWKSLGEDEVIKKLYQAIQSR